MGAPTVAGFERTFVLQLTCRCNSCAKKVQKHLKQIHGIGSILTDAAEGKVTISGSMVDQYTVITELKKLNIQATLIREKILNENIIEENQIGLHKSKVLEGQSEVVPSKPADNNQVVDEFASSLSPDIQSKHEHKLELNNFHGKVTISALYLVLVFVMAGFGGQFFIRKFIDFLSGASIIIFFLSGFVFASALIMGSMVDPYSVNTELKKLKKKATLSREEIPIEKQIVLRKSEVLEDQSKVVLCKPADNNQFVDEFASSLSPDIQSKHEHKLELKNFDKRFTCNGCKEEGFRSRYRCEQCDYDLHHDCMFPKTTVSHELFEGSIFEFSNKRLIPTCGDRDCRAQVHMISCDACGNEIHGCFYHCKANNLSLHPCCINLKSKLCIQGSTFSLKNKASSKCFWCNVKSKKGFNSGWSYVSECENYQFHVKCIVQMAHEAWKKKVDEDVDAYSVVLAESLNMRLVRKSKRNGWSRGAKFVEMIVLIARTIIGILFGDPTAILAPIVVDLLKN